MGTEAGDRRSYRRIADDRGGPVARRYARTLLFSASGDTPEIVEGLRFMPAFGADGLLPCVVQDAVSGAVLFLATMDREALSLTLRSGIAHFRSTARGRFWHRCPPSGTAMRVAAIQVDGEQRSLLLQGWCIGGLRSSYSRAINLERAPADLAVALKPAAATATAVAELPNQQGAWP
ncbi:MAG: phosphoribosyl-AMP cyclohydrolase [Betaproteobacteria bacterium]